MRTKKAFRKVKKKQTSFNTQELDSASLSHSLFLSLNSVTMSFLRALSLPLSKTASFPPSKTLCLFPLPLSL